MFLQLYHAKFDLNSDKWRFRYAEQTILVDISETDIAKNAAERGIVNAKDTYKVLLKTEQRKTQSGNFRNYYSISKVLEFTPALIQSDLLRDE